MPKLKTPGAFTPRIIKAIDLASEDKTDAMIADEMGISEGGVQSLFRNGRDISGLHSRIAMFRKALEDGDLEVKPKKSDPENGI